MTAHAIAANCALADIVVECAPAEHIEETARPALEAGRTLVVISVGALLDREFLIDLAARHGGRIVVPSGALFALDAVMAGDREKAIEEAADVIAIQSAIEGLDWPGPA